MIRKADDNRARMEAKMDQVFKAVSNSNNSGGGGAPASANTVVPRTKLEEEEPPPTFVAGPVGRRETSPVVASLESGRGVGSVVVGGGHGDGRRRPQGGEDGNSDRPRAQSSEPDLDEFIDQYHTELG